MDQIKPLFTATATATTLSQADSAALKKEAHEKICPYSNATRSNVNVGFVVVGA